VEIVRKWAPAGSWTSKSKGKRESKNTKRCIAGRVEPSNDLRMMRCILAGWYSPPSTTVGSRASGWFSDVLRCIDTTSLAIMTFLTSLPLNWSICLCRLTFVCCPNSSCKSLNLVFTQLPTFNSLNNTLSALTWPEGHPACKNWVVRYWHSYLSAARCKWFAYRPDDATANPIISCSSKIQNGLPFWCRLTQVVLEKNICSSSSSSSSS